MNDSPSCQAGLGATAKRAKRVKGCAAMKSKQVLQARIHRLRAALDAATDVGVYPKSVVGMYEKRTEYMDGWNAAQKASIIEAIKVLEPGDLE